MSELDFPSDDEQFKAQIKSSFDLNSDYGAKIALELLTKCKELAAENQKLIKENSDLKSELKKASEHAAKQKRVTELLVESADERERVLQDQIRSFSRTANDRSTRNLELNKLKAEIVQLLDEKKKTEGERDDALKRVSRLEKEFKRGNEDDLKLGRALQRVDALRAERNVLKDRKRVLNEENRVLKRQAKLTEVRRHDCSFHVQDLNATDQKSAFLEHKRRMFEE